MHFETIDWIKWDKEIHSSCAFPELNRSMFLNCSGSRNNWLQMSVLIFFLRFLTKASFNLDGYDLKISFLKLSWKKLYWVLELEYMANGLPAFRKSVFSWANIVIPRREMIFSWSYRYVDKVRIPLLDSGEKKKGKIEKLTYYVLEKYSLFFLQQSGEKLKLTDFYCSIVGESQKIFFVRLSINTRKLITSPLPLPFCGSICFPIAQDESHYVFQ